MKYYCWEQDDAEFWFLSNDEQNVTLYRANMVVFRDNKIMSDGKVITKDEFQWRLEHPDEVYMQAWL